MLHGMMELLQKGGEQAQRESRAGPAGTSRAEQGSEQRRYVSPALAVFLVVYLAFCCLALNCISCPAERKRV